ncbi:MAG: NAD(P)H-hydrate epimerase [Candidatus Omnitrophota bacterium]
MIVTKERLLTSALAKRLDLIAVKKLGISTLVLMENAARAVAQEILNDPAHKKIIIVCGKGNNGGDGLAAARHLIAEGLKPRVFIVGNLSSVKNEARVNLNILLKLKIRIIGISPRNFSLLRRKLFSADLIVDALLGVGLKGEVGGLVKRVIEAINSSSAKVLCVDIPSGLDATTGQIRGACVRAERTITFVAKKRGMFKNSGPGYCGKILVKGIGIPL